MKKRVAIFANGWSNEYLELVFEGIRKKAADTNVDLYAFVNYSSGSEGATGNTGETSIFELPDIATFDGAIVLANTINLPSERAFLRDQIVNNHIPAVSVEYPLEGLPHLYTNTYSGIYALTSHLTQVHNVREVIYVSGPADNSENQTRKQAVIDALAEVGGALPEENILYGNWSYYDTYAAMGSFLNSDRTLPDAFVCANDEMAIAVCSILNDYGLKVPEQVLVTGCDCTKRSQEIYPILSTVVREWDQLGSDSLDMVLKQIEGISVPDSVEYQSVPVFGESCSCKVNELRKEHRRSAIIKSQQVQRESNLDEWYLRHLDDLLAKITSFNSLRDHLGWNLEYNHAYEGANFLICMVEDFFNDYDPSQGGSMVFPDTMEILVNIKDGKPIECGRFPTVNLVPDIDIDTEHPHMYIFLPLHTGDRLVGYAIFIDSPYNLYKQTLYTWGRHISQDLDRVHQNIRLEEMNKKLTLASMTDALTGLNNRTGYDALAFPLLKRCQEENRLSCMVFADINRMKLINDKYGHLQGDIALRTVADAIKMTMPADWIAVRFGGDEFIMVGECQSEEEAENLKNHLAANLDTLKNQQNLSFPLSVSFGAVVIHPGESYNLEEYLRKADEAMYVMKQKVHAAE